MTIKLPVKSGKKQLTCNFGRGALISHSKGKGHKKAMALVAGQTMLQFVKTM